MANHLIGSNTYNTALQRLPPTLHKSFKRSAERFERGVADALSGTGSAATTFEREAKALTRTTEPALKTELTNLFADALSTVQRAGGISADLRVRIEQLASTAYQQTLGAVPTRADATVNRQMAELGSRSLGWRESTEPLTAVAFVQSKPGVLEPGTLTVVDSEVHHTGLDGTVSIIRGNGEVEIARERGEPVSRKYSLSHEHLEEMAKRVDDRCLGLRLEGSRDFESYNFLTQLAEELHKQSTRPRFSNSHGYVRFDLRPGDAIAFGPGKPHVHVMGFEDVQKRRTVVAALELLDPNAPFIDRLDAQTHVMSSDLRELLEQKRRELARL